MAKLNDLEDVTISNPKVGDVVKYTATGWQNGEDAGGDGVNGNPCGNLDHYTRDDQKETITEPWDWEIEDDECLHIRTPNQLGFYCANKVNVSTTVSSVAIRAEDNGDGALKSVNKLVFKDIQVPDGVTLGELVAGANGGGSGVVAGNNVISAGFSFGGVNAQWSENIDGWRQLPGIDSQDQRYLNFKVSDPLEVTLPAWATGCALIYTQRTEWQFGDNIQNNDIYGSGATTCFRQYTSHKLTLEGGRFVVGYPTPADGQNTMANVISINTTLPFYANVTDGTYINGAETTNFQVIQLTTASRTIKLTQTVDFLGGGWGRITSSPGKLLLIPIVFDPNNIVTSATANSPTTFVGSDDEYMDMLNEYYPPYTEEDSIMDETQQLKTAIISALNICNDALAETPGDPTIEGIRANLYSLKTETSLEFAGARFKILVGQLRDALDWKFEWEPIGYSLV